MVAVVTMVGDERHQLASYRWCQNHCHQHRECCSRHFKPSTAQPDLCEMVEEIELSEHYQFVILASP